MSRDLQLLGRAKRTHDGYLREVRKLACYFNLSPDQLTEQQVADYLLHLINERKFAPGSLKVSYSALKFFYSVTCPRDWDVLEKLRVPKQKTLPDVLTIKQVHQLIAATKQLHNATFLWTIYTLGLRLEEGLNLQIGDIDSQRMTVHIHRGKGAKDRYLPLPTSTLDVLRNYWKQHRNARLLFPPTVATETLRQTRRLRWEPVPFKAASDESEKNWASTSPSRRIHFDTAWQLTCLKQAFRCVGSRNSLATATCKRPWSIFT